MTIVEAAESAIRTLGGSPSLDEIYAKIIELRLFTFDTDVPEHVLRTQIHRHCNNVTRVDNVTDPRFTRFADDNYAMIETTLRTTGIRRIHRAKNKDGIIRQLMDDLGVFREIWRLLLFSAMLGARAGRRISLGDVDSGKGIDQSTFGNCGAWPGVVHLLAIVEKQESTVLADVSEEARIAMFEEYANGGLEILQEHFNTAPLRVQSLIDLTEKFGTQTTPQVPNVDLSI
jgi:dnd system-associated protein 4